MNLPIEVRRATPADFPAIASLHARVFGPGRFARTAYRVREGTAPVSRFCWVAMLGDGMVASLRMTEVTIGGKSGALLLGPIAVDQDFARQGFGKRLVGEALDAAHESGFAIVVLVGDDPYYGRFGFNAVRPGQIVFPGPVDPRRILACELRDGALANFSGAIVAV